MKKLLLLLAALGGTLLAAQAQTTIGRGTGLLTGSVGYHTETNDITFTAAAVAHPTIPPSPTARSSWTLPWAVSWPITWPWACN